MTQREWPPNVQRAAVDRVDAFVLRRMRTLLDRATRGVGRQQDAVLDVVDAGFPVAADRGAGDAVPSPAEQQVIVDQFHRIYYDSAATTWQNTTYRGVTIWKNPLDLWMYQEIVHEVRPALIVETGTAYGGSALYLADLCDVAGCGHVVTIDNRDRAADVEHPRLTKIIASSADADVRARVAELVPDGGPVVVILDSDHARDHVLAELRLWADIVTPGSHLIVEDTNVNGHPVFPDFGPGPWEALDTFLAETGDFVVDESKHKFLMTWNPRGFLKRVAAPGGGEPAVT